MKRFIAISLLFFNVIQTFAAPRDDSESGAVSIGSVIVLIIILFFASLGGSEDQIHKPRILAT